MYEAMYHQRLHEPDESKWQFKIVPWREVISYQRTSDSRLRLKLKDTCNEAISFTRKTFDLVFVGTGYERNAYEAILDPARPLLQDGKFTVERNYRLRFKKDAVADDCGLWLQGCCQSSHGVSQLPPVDLGGLALTSIAVERYLALDTGGERRRDGGLHLPRAETQIQRSVVISMRASIFSHKADLTLCLVGAMVSSAFISE